MNKIYMGYYDANKPRIETNNMTSAAIGLITVVFAIIGIISLLPKTVPVKSAANFISPCPKTGCNPTPTPTSTPKPMPTTSPMPLERPTSGKASYYSVDGCIGCSENRTMANGERLDDTRLTIAYNHAPLNTRVKIRNVKNGKTVTATITDRGGFENLPIPKIADLSVATRDALDCQSTCQIEIIF